MKLNSKLSDYELKKMVLVSIAMFATSQILLFYDFPSLMITTFQPPAPLFFLYAITLLLIGISIIYGLLMVLSAIILSKRQRTKNYGK